MPKLILFTDNQIILTKDNDFIELDCLVDTDKCGYSKQIINNILALQKNSQLVNLRFADRDLNLDNNYYAGYYTGDVASLDFDNQINNQINNKNSLKIATLRSVLLNSDINKIKLITRARQLAHWRHDHQYCGRCGSLTTALTKEHAMQCNNCGLLNYPRISPCIVAAVIKNNEILLGRSPHFSAGVYSLLAGFVEVGETAEETVIREVYEESKIRVKNISYFGSQSWPFPHSLMMAFKAEYESGKIIVDYNELEDVRWFSISSLRTCPELLPARGSLSRMVLDDVINNA